MGMKGVVIFILIALPFGGIGQEKPTQQVFSNDTLIYYYHTDLEGLNGIDSVPMIKGELRFHQDFVIVDSLPPHRVLATFQNRNDSICYEYSFESDELAFRLVELYEKGPVIIESWCQSGVKCVDWEISEEPQLINTFFCNGQLACEYKLHHYYIVGPHTCWHENGKKKFVINYDLKGNKHGTCKFFDDQGHLTHVEIYEEGELVETRFE